MTRGNLIGWALTIAGCALWAYGYFATGHQALVDWAAFAPSWIANYMPSLEAEIGIFLMFAAMVPMYWPQRRG